MEQTEACSQDAVSGKTTIKTKFFRIMIETEYPVEKVLSGIST